MARSLHGLPPDRVPSRALTALPGASPPTQGVKASPAAIHYPYAIYIYMYIYVYIYILYTYIYTYIFILYVYRSISSSNRSAWRVATYTGRQGVPRGYPLWVRDIYVYVHIYTYISIYLSIYLYIYTYTYKYIHTYIKRCLAPRRPRTASRRVRRPSTMGTRYICVYLYLSMRYAFEPCMGYTYIHNTYIYIYIALSGASPPNTGR